MVLVLLAVSHHAMKFNQFTCAKLRLYFETTKVFTAFLVAQVYNPTL